MTADDDAGKRAAPSAVARARRVAGANPGRPRPSALRRNAPQPGVVFDSAAPPSPPPAGSAEPKNSRAGRNLPAAIGVGLGLAAIIVPSLFVYRASFAFIVGVIVLYGCWELSQALAGAGIQVSIAPLMAGTVAVLIATWERGPSGLMLAVLITLLAVVVWRVADGAHGYTRDATGTALAVLYVPTLAAFAVLLVHPSDGAARVLAFAATVVCSDTGGYATGVLFGKHPLAPVVSKAKTWEGFTGSVLACAACGTLFMTLTFHEAWWKGLLFGLAIAATATVGDLGESMIKRDLDIKDMGRLLPGHGGVMDRLDSMLPCAAVAYLLLSAFAPV
jgi:phosphatidate cytidylyltransferase